MTAALDLEGVPFAKFAIEIAQGVILELDVKVVHLLHAILC